MGGNININSNSNVNADASKKIFIKDNNKIKNIQKKD